ncbi:MAG: hypothetical protein WHT82_08050 [Limisphaera sp.]
MPKDEFDPEDPWELNRVAVPTEEDTLPAMAETFVEEFMRMGYGAPQVLALFRNPHYVGPYAVRARHGEGFVRELIARVFQRWGRTPDWGRSCRIAAAERGG